MITQHTAETLKAFELRVAEAFNAGLIRAPIHLDGGNEEPLLEIFEDVKETDWLAGSWRQHYHCLLKGVPEEELFAEIMAGRSIGLQFPKYRIVSSAIVGGIIPIALGIAWQIKRGVGSERVWCFVGDMTARTGIYNECCKYARGFGLPIVFVIEDNKKSVMTDTSEVWGDRNIPSASGMLRAYSYELPWPHSGAGRRINF